MTSEEGVYHGYDPGTSGSSGMGAGAMHGQNEPAAWPRAAEEMASRGWWPTLLAAGGSIVTILGAMFLARRRSKRGGLMAAMAAMPAPLAEASEQMLRRRNGRRSPWRALIALGAVALAGWGIRRTMAHMA